MRPAVRTAGITLIEVVIYTTILAILGAPVVSMVVVSSRYMSEVDAQYKVQERSRVLLFRLEEDLREAILASVTITNAGKTLQFTLPDSFDGTAVVPGPDIQYEFQLATGESSNGSDDNGNGLVDEGMVVRRNLTDSETVSLSGGLDLDNSSFAPTAGGVTVNLTLVGRLREANSTIAVSSTLNVYPYN